MSDLFKEIESGSFAEVCYDMNSIGELSEALVDQPDLIDLRVWDLIVNEWSDQINLALAALIEEVNEL